MIAAASKPLASAQTSPNQSLYPLTAEVNARQHLAVGGCDVVELAAEFGTPLYVVDETTVRQACRAYVDNLTAAYSGPSLVLYATKAWNCKALCALVVQEGLGLDVVSGGELYGALQVGVPGDRIYLHGNYKSAAEIQMALEAGCTLVVDNEHELEMASELAAQLGVTGRVMLRITPGIECHTHEYIRTGHIDSKFGFDPTQVPIIFERLSQISQLNFIGLHAHIGSQIFELQPHADLGGVMVQMWQKAQSYGLQPCELNIGGGLGIRYLESDDPPSIAQWTQAVSQGVTQAFEGAGLPLPTLLCEPGRSLIGSSTITAYTVGGSKVVPDIRTYVTVDGGMSDNPRPITYQAEYTPVVANCPLAETTQTATIAGKHCESGDVLLKDIRLPSVRPGDILTVLGTGAYNYSMASNYNRLPRPAAVLVREGKAEVIVERETYVDVVRQDILPDRLAL
ncbi:MAG: diaminopimelate decarboxylase [Cyanobacteria bacterium P01_F01_bin.33]